MPLHHLSCAGTRASDLSPLTGMPLNKLWIGSTQVSDLSPLKGVPPTFLGCAGTKVSDLSPLKGSSLRWLEFDYKPERDAAILRTIPTLESINNKPAKDVLNNANVR